MLKIAPRVTASFHDAGHILGSAAIRVKYTARGNTTTVLFSGDLGRSNMPILRDPEPPPPCDVLILESTYGDRLHEADRESMKQKALDLLTHAKTHKSKIIVPAFAVGRTQELVMRIKELVGEGRLDPIPIYIDSPLASRATEVFRRHPECFDEETTRTFTSSGDLFCLTLYPFCLFAGRQQAPEQHEGPLRHHLRLRHVRRRPRRASSQARDSRRSERDRLRGLSSRAYPRAQTRRRVGCRARFSACPLRAGRRSSSSTGSRPMRIARILLAYVRAIRPGPSKIFLVHGEEKQALSWPLPFRRNTPN